MITTYKNVIVRVDSNELFLNSASITISQNVDRVYLLNDKYPRKIKANNSFVETILSLQYNLQPNDPLKNKILKDSLLNCSFGGIQLNNGFLSKYNLSVNTNRTITVNAEILFWNTPTSNLSIQTQDSINDIEFLHSPNLTITELDGEWTSGIEITSLTYNYSAEPILCIKIKNPESDTLEIGNVTPDRILLNNPQANIQINGNWWDTVQYNLNGNYVSALLTFSSSETSDELYIAGYLTNRSSNVENKGLAENSIEIIQSSFFKTPSIIDFTAPPYDPNENISITFDTINSIQKIDFRGEQLSNYNLINNVLSLQLPSNAISGNLNILTDGGEVNTGLMINTPSITVASLSSYTGKYLDKLYINGTNFFDITKVYFGIVPTEFFEVINDKFIITSVPKNASYNYVNVVSESRGISGYSDQKFISLPVITGVNPYFGDPTQIINIYGYNFSGVDTVSFNSIISPNISVITDTHIIAEVPTGNIFGQIALINEGELISYSASMFEPDLRITGFSIDVPAPGDQIQISGKNFYSPYMFKYGSDDKFAIKFAENEIGEFNIVSNILLQGNTPENYKAGHVYVVKPDGGSLYTGSMYLGKEIVSPTLYSTNNTVAYSGVPFYVTMYGVNLENVSGIHFRGITEVNNGQLFVLNNANIFKNDVGTSLSVLNYTFAGNPITGTYDVVAIATGDKLTIAPAAYRVNLLPNAS